MSAITQQRVFIGVDDTDAGDSIGTGALSRELMQHLVRDFGAVHLGITRHQLFVHPDIPYTSHNSSACLEIACDCRFDSLADACRRFIDFLFHPGADPGLCVAPFGRPFEEAAAYGRRAQKEIVGRAEAFELAKKAGFTLEERGGDGLGVIGAFAACGLRMSGRDGRFISHRGIREVPEKLTAAELCRNTAVELVVDEQGERIDDDALIVTHGWIRPDLVGGRVVTRVLRCGDDMFEVAKRKKNQDDM